MRQVVVLTCFFIIVPIALGCLFRNEKNVSLTFVWPMGFFLECAIFELWCVSMTICGATFTLLMQVYCGTLLGILCLVIYKKKNVIFLLFKERKWGIKIKSIGSIILILLIIVQIYIPMMMTEYGSWDDSSYLVTALDTIRTNSLWRTNPYSGEYMLMPSKRILTSWSIYNAFLSYATGIAPATLSHFVEPVIMIPMTYSVIIEMARKLFDKEDNQVEFAIMVGVLLMFGFRANSAMEHWILMWPWSGRSILFAIIIPFTLSYMLETLKQGFDMKNAIGIVVLNVAACSFTTMSIGMMTVLLFMILASYRIENKKQFSASEVKSILVAFFPQVIFLIIYVLWRGDNGYS